MKKGIKLILPKLIPYFNSNKNYKWNTGLYLFINILGEPFSSIL